MVSGSATLEMATVVIPRSADGFVVIAASGGMHNVRVRVVKGRPPSRVQDGTFGASACGTDVSRRKMNHPVSTATMTTARIANVFRLTSNSTLI
jgi:hypothetical protein